MWLRDLWKARGMKYAVGQRVIIVAVNPKWAPRDGLETTIIDIDRESLCPYILDVVGMPPLTDGQSGWRSAEYGLRPVPPKYDGNTLTSWEDVRVWKPRDVRV